MGVRTVATTFGESATNRIGLALIFLGLAAAQIAVWGIPAWTYRASLGVATALFLIAAARTRSDAPGPASHRITRLARFSTGLLAFGVACDLLAGAWRLP
jgi:4-hydroxybenzoate polyprenyltransferase